jgi:hypothetical protein
VLSLDHHVESAGERGPARGWGCGSVVRPGGASRGGGGRVVGLPGRIPCRRRRRRRPCRSAVGGMYDTRRDRSPVICRGGGCDTHLPTDPSSRPRPSREKFGEYASTMLNCAVRRRSKRRGVSRARRDGARFWGARFWEARRSRSCREGKRKKTLTRQFRGCLDGRLRFRVVRDSSSYMGTESARKPASRLRREHASRAPNRPTARNCSRIREAAENARSRVSRSRRRARENAESGVVIFPWRRRDAERFSRRAGGFAHAQCPRRPGLRRARDRA